MGALALNCGTGFQPAPASVQAGSPRHEMQAGSPHHKGFTLMTTLISLAILAVLVAGICGSMAGAARHRRVLWEEVQARELAVSVLEHAVAERRVALTPAGGETVNPATMLSGQPTPLMEVEIKLFVEAVKDAPGLHQITAEVAWRSGADVETVRKVRHEVVQ